MIKEKEKQEKIRKEEHITPISSHHFTILSLVVNVRIKVRKVFIG